MATCAKCGCGRIKKRPDGRRKCKRHGFLPGPGKKLNTAGEEIEKQKDGK